VTTQDIWTDIREGARHHRRLRQEVSNTARAVIMAVLEAGRWIDAGLQNKNKMAETIADKPTSTPASTHQPAHLGRYQNGLGKTWTTRTHEFFDAARRPTRTCPTACGS